MLKHGAYLGHPYARTSCCLFNLLQGKHLFRLMRKNDFNSYSHYDQEVAPPIIWKTKTEATGQSNLRVHMQINGGLYMEWNNTVL